MNACPYCEFKFQIFIPKELDVTLPPVTPIVCADCGEIFAFVPESADARKATPEEIAEFRQRDCWPWLAKMQRYFQAHRMARNARNN